MDKSVVLIVLNAAFLAALVLRTAFSISRGRVNWGSGEGFSADRKTAPTSFWGLISINFVLIGLFVFLLNRLLALE